MLTQNLHPELDPRYHVRCSHLVSGAQNAALAEGKGGRLLYLWRLVLHTACSWGPAVRGSVYASARGDEGVSGRDWVLWHWDLFIRGMFVLIGCYSPQLCSDERLLQFRIPERLAPGKFDILGSSHQLFHIAIMCGMYSHLTGLVQGFTSAHTLDVCQIKGAGGHGGN